ncbi:hypothetical protein VNO78_15734 [Psophocarpus tetragonolobus]|uniref:Uncharacterized protein n=1 Tax=Psophocarpus tetragonolobus TaxID=3891 RepID=A0AAN9XJF2_PSOTE
MKATERRSSAPKEDKEKIKKRKKSKKKPGARIKVHIIVNKIRDEIMKIPCIIVIYSKVIRVDRLESDVTDKYSSK